MGDLCTISEVHFDDTPLRPCILNFENGTLQSGQENKLLCQMYQNSDNKKHSVVAATENMLYRGEVNPDELYNNFIAIRSKADNTIRLIAVDYVTLSPRIKIKEEPDVSESVVKITTSELNKQFGSKRVKRETEQHERMQLDIENVREQLEQTVADVKVNVQDMVAPPVDENDSSYRPRINRNAEKVEDVYILNEIVAENVLSSIYDEAINMLENEGEMGTTNFVTHEIKKLQASSLIKKERACQLLLYIDCLIKFMLCQAKAISTKTYSACSYSNIVHKDILQKFTISGKYRPAVMRDKCVCYILVLGMIACNRTLNLGMITQDLKMGFKKVQTVSKILGFTVVKEFAMLKLPLPAPVSNVRAGRKKK